jgi:hypothetical protein
MGRDNLRQVIIVIEFLARFAQHRNALFERDARDFAGLGQFEFVDVVDAANQLSFLLVARIELAEDEEHEILQHAHDLVVVLLELHFEIQARELGQVARRVGVFGAEDGADFHDFLEARGDEHLLVELGRLG